MTHAPRHVTDAHDASGTAHDDAVAQPAPLLTEDDFHRARRMFAVIDGTVLVAPAGLPLTHRQWLQGFFSPGPAALFPATTADLAFAAWFGRLTRGYTLGSVLVAYRGDAMSRPDMHDVVLAAAVLDPAGDRLTEIGLGVVMGCGGGQPWAPKRRVPADRFRRDALRLAERARESGAVLAARMDADRRAAEAV